MAVKDWSTTSADNTAIDGTDISEGCPASGINDAIRKVMASVKGADFGATVIKFDNATESTAAGGVTIEAVTLKDGAITALTDAATTRTTLGLGDAATGTIGVEVQAYDADTLKADTTDTLTAGFNATEYDAGTQTTGTFTPDPANGNFQKAVNGGAHTLAPPGSTCSICIQYTNNASAGTVTTSGFTQQTGDTISTTDGDDFLFYVTRNNSFSHLHVVALQ